MATSPMSGVIQHLRRVLRDGAGLTDGQLLEDYISRRDEAAIAALVRRHEKMVWGVCCRVLRNHHDAEDAFQATFLVLVRRASSIASRELLANWLYGVAHQTALKARATAAKRKGRERQVKEMPEPALTQQDQWCDVSPVLDEELSRLPDHYRGVIVMCDLEGMTRKVAARQLGIPEGSVASRLARARTMLAKRLTQRGVVFSCGSLSAGSASASAPPALVASTIKAASLLAAGRAAGVVSAKVAALTEGVLKTMLLTKLKIALGLVFVFVLTCGTGILATHAQAEKAGPAPKQVKENADKPKDTAPFETTFRKLVLAYNDNDAKGDNEFLGKKLRVSGRVLRVQRAGTGKALHYLLRLYADSSEDRFPGVVILTDKMAPAFVFPADARERLAKLEGGQKVTIEGVCEGRTTDGGDAITFTDCKIVKAKE